MIILILATVVIFGLFSWFDHREEMKRIELAEKRRTDRRATKGR